MPRIDILNVKYSPNLGDGVIAECLEEEIARQRPGWDAKSVDLAGRQDFGTGLDSARGRVLRVVDTMPLFLRRIALFLILSALVRFRLRSHWRRELKGSDAIVLGGGQLIAGADFNFPIKINGVLKEIRRPRRPFAVFGVGVAGNLNRTAKALFKRGLKPLEIVHVAVRDGASVAHWDSQIAANGIATAARCRDPGLLAGEVYSKSAFGEDRVRPLVGLGIVNPRTLDRHSSAVPLGHVDRALDQSAQLARCLLASGFDVSLFTNGPHDDEKYLGLVLESVGNPRLRRSPRPRLPRDLAGIVRSFDAVVAHRLHANILAYAFRIPHVGLAWDPKVRAFFNSVDRGPFVVDLVDSPPHAVCSLVARAYRDGIDRTTHRRVVQETRQAVGVCLDHLAAGMGEGRSEEKLKLQNSVGA
ncbi:polysaccharide pyruvyl transferase family protein [Erythrobacter sp. THAF29]|uniref:polysaccharide pyruvyl transferase family protein n=1 Tax=Erythrobacter sp. THAF29 TaxID=2587851 RepID=UPI001267E153|nr:polysaccharide pyruvyl transferase family protein [Erythrobacter sp. THAF29]QFT77348.1 Polysaccharide pyruvyl transferase [Erythrobacter sp. THAF29]